MSEVPLLTTTAMNAAVPPAGAEAGAAAAVPVAPDTSPALRREVGLFGAVMLGLGSILGTGIFVSIGLAAGIAGPAVLLAILLAGGVALCNALSSAQLAASHPVSGGTYEYGYKYLHPKLGFTAGWMFLCAKSASAATAAQGLAGYLLQWTGGAADWRLPVAVAAVVGVTVLAATGMKRSSGVNSLIVAVTIVALAVLVAVGGGSLSQGAVTARFEPFWPPASDAGSSWQLLLHATALMFVAYTGYGRIATLGEEVRAPRRTIPRAILITLAVSAALYLAVGAVAIAVLGAPALAAATHSAAAPLEQVARQSAGPWLRGLVAVGALTAMLGVLLNLVLGLSRIVLAMARRRDLPVGLSRLHTASATPVRAVLLVGAVIAGISCIGDVRVTWSFSALTVLIYYALTNWSALRLPAGERRYSRLFAWGGLVACLLLVFFIEAAIWRTGAGLIAVGLLWQDLAQRRRQRTAALESAV